VIGVFNLGDGMAVTISHGKYFTTYSNLSGVSVSKGSQVRTGRLLAAPAQMMKAVRFRKHPVYAAGRHERRQPRAVAAPLISISCYLFQKLIQRVCSFYSKMIY
jgi:hypothetical protein